MIDGVVRYELLYIIPTSFTDDEATQVETKVQGLIAKAGGTVESSRRLGKYRLAYAINNQRHGFYVLTYFTAPSSATAKINELLRITTEVLRHLILRADEAGESKFDLVQFTEVVVETPDRRGRRSKDASKDKEEKDGEAKDIKDEAAELDGDKAKDTSEDTKLSEDEVDAKVESALKEDEQQA